MNEANSPEPRACKDDDLPPPTYNACEVSAEVKPKPIINTEDFLFIYFFWIIMCSTRINRHDCILCCS